MPRRGFCRARSGSGCRRGACGCRRTGTCRWTLSMGSASMFLLKFSVRHRVPTLSSPRLSRAGRPCPGSNTCGSPCRPPPGARRRRRRHGRPPPRTAGVTIYFEPNQNRRYDLSRVAGEAGEWFTAMAPLSKTIVVYCWASRLVVWWGWGAVVQGCGNAWRQIIMKEGDGRAMTICCLSAVNLFFVFCFRPARRISAWKTNTIRREKSVCSNGTFRTTDSQHF